MPKYVCSRKDVCAGSLIKSFDLSYKIYDENDCEISEEELAKQGITNLSISGGIVCRRMLFSVNNDDLTNDLIYDTPNNYPIEGISPRKEIQSKFIVQHYVELEELLKYLKFGENLTQKDLDKIYRKLLVRNWWLNHHQELFGYRKTTIGYVSDGIQTLPTTMYNQLSTISLAGNTKPHPEEPEYRLIKKRK